MISKAKSLIIILVTAILGLGIGLAFTKEPPPVIAPTPTPTITPEPTKRPISSLRVESLVNDWRVSQDLSVFVHSENLCSIAKQRLPEVKKNWSHEGFSYKRFCSSCTLGENLARGYSTEEEILSNWLFSPSHKENLTKNYTHSCIQTDGYYVVQIFGYF